MTAHVIAYGYEADIHCVDCALGDLSRMKVDHHHSYAMGGPCLDDNLIECDVVDGDGNLIHPVFATDEHQETHCGNCRKALR